MAQTIYASFADASLCERAAGALLDYGVRKEDLSLLANERAIQTSEVGYAADNVASIPEAGWRGGETRGAVLDRPTPAGDIEDAAKTGISTTTPGDAAAGAAKGAGIGLGLGVLAGLGSLLIPGVGLVIGSGALATALGGAVGATAAGAVAGGVTGFFKDQGINEPTAQHYNDTISSGGAVLAVTLPSNKVDVAMAQTVLNKYGATNLSNI